ncbi:MAG: DUF2813 domain-containing protein [Gammaproteobacteria bacterium]|nr:DUF2813 domain-containing protein [Gammaproteobacteria bacterium]
MRLTRVEIQDFRSIRHLVLDFGETTVLIGPNNAGKSAILDAMRLALTRPWGRTEVGEAPSGASIRTSIRICVEESAPGEWPRGGEEKPDSKARSYLSRERRSLALVTRFARNRESGKIEPRRRLLEAVDEPRCGRRYRHVKADGDWRHLPVFYLGPLRDVDKEYWSNFPRFWEQRLRAAELPAGLESDAQDVLDRLYSRLQKGDPAVMDINLALAGINDDMLLHRDWVPDFSKLPREMSNDPRFFTWFWLPDELRHWSPPEERGQGMQSLSVFSMFLAFVRHFLDELYVEDRRPALLVEEPETHLHPHAVRTLWRHIQAQPGQRIVTTHSPYLVQNTSFRDLRLVRFTDDGTKVSSLPERFSVSIADLDGLEREVERSNGLLEYDQPNSKLTVSGVLHKKVYRRLLGCCGAHERRRESQRVLRELRDRSARYIGDDELRSLETFAQRIRGEIFFAERWLIVEGQADYLIVHGLAHAMECDLDGYRVSVIDAQNNGNPVAFATLARGLDIPWVAVFDGDTAGEIYKQQLLKRGFDNSELKQLCLLHPAGDLETQLVHDGLRSELCEILAELGVEHPSGLTKEALVKRLSERKVGYAAKLAERFRADPDMAHRGPEAFRAGIAEVVSLNRKSVLPGIDSW